MAEVHEEATHVWCHKRRLAFFFSAMRHFREELRTRDITVHYHELTAKKSTDRGPDFSTILRRDVPEHAPRKLIVLEPGDHRVLKALQKTAMALKLPLEIRPDRHFYCRIDEFRDWARGKKSLVMENFYRQMRQKHDVLMLGGKPVGGEWNFDKDNRETFSAKSPPRVPNPEQFAPDAITNQVLSLVGKRFADHPGSIDDFDLPVTRSQARAFLADFVRHRLEKFGPYEDAMWEGETFLYHSRLSALLNLHLLNPRECIDAAVSALEEKRAPLNSVEGFVRQIIGWREFIRGIYWLHMPEYAEMNALDCSEELPPFFWNGETDMRCAADAMRSVIDHGYAHHIQRLMVLGQFSLLYGVHPHRFHEWHMAMYLDAIDWVSLPNTLGMSQYGDGGIVGTKPYCATGNYIDRMGNYCSRCRYDPKVATGENACPFTTFYWDFLDRHRERFADNHRMGFQMKNLERKKPAELAGILEWAGELRRRIAAGTRI